MTGRDLAINVASVNPRTARLGIAVRGIGLTLALVGSLSLYFAGAASAKAPPAHAYYGASEVTCFTPDGGATVGAKVDAYVGAHAKKNNALRRFEIKYRLIYADTTAGLGLAKPGYKVAATPTKRFSDSVTWTHKKNDLSTNRESGGGDYHVEMEFVWIRGGGRPNWKVKNQVYALDESTCSGFWASP